MLMIVVLMPSTSQTALTSLTLWLFYGSILICTPQAFMSMDNATYVLLVAAVSVSSCSVCRVSRSVLSSSFWKREKEGSLAFSPKEDRREGVRKFMTRI